MRKTNLVLDTNVLIYGINEESEFFDRVREVLEDRQYSFYVTTKTISEFVSVLSKLDRYDVIENELPSILNNYTIIYPNKKSTKIFQELVNKYRPRGNKVFDIEIVSIMLSKKLKNIFTFNTQDFISVAEIYVSPG
jgi:predicted nucleic acid-binding protein